jgi:hypothetical protein
MDDSSKIQKQIAQKIYCNIYYWGLKVGDPIYLNVCNKITYDATNIFHEKSNKMLP